MKKQELELYKSIKEMIVSTKAKVAVTVNRELVLLYWHIGHKIKHQVLKNKRADYRKAIIVSLSEKLMQEFGRGYSRTNVRNFVIFAELFPDIQIVQSVSGQLSWTHIYKILYIKYDLKRAFYIELCKAEKWSTRVLQQKINSMLYERTAISKKPEKLIKQELELLKKEDKMSANLVFRDPYILDFLDLRDTYSEKDLETAILAHLQAFIGEMGTDFAFLARQKRITIDGEDFYIDLLFFHRRMRCLVAIDLKLGKFKAAHKGQMELYLRWLEKHDKREGEGSPVGLILCAEKSQEHIELLMLDNSNIKVSEYLMNLPDKHVFKAKLQKAIAIVKQQLESRMGK